MDTIGKIYIAVTIVSLIGMIFAFSLISKRSPKGTLLIVGIVLFFVGRTISGIPVREVRGISGICMVSGFIGGLLGLFNLFRKRKDAVKATMPEPGQPPPLQQAIQQTKADGG